MSKGFDIEFLAQQMVELRKKFSDKDDGWMYNFSMDFGIFLILNNLLEIKPEARQVLRDAVVSFLDEMLVKNAELEEKG